MPDANDMDLVREYATANSEPAFETLVRRHVSLVYSVALRQVGNPAQAEEITQAVFLILARKAARLRPDTVLAAWLHETARFASASFLRGELRRQRREQEAYVQSKLQESTADPAWEQLAPLLDEAIGQLGKADRNAVVLRFFQNKSSREIAAALNVHESAAQKRVNRAVEKLRAWFLKRGVAVSAGVLTGALSVNSVHGAPAHLAASVMAVSAKGTAVSSSTLTLVKGALKIMAWTKAKTAIVAGAAVLFATGTATITVKEIQNHSSWRVEGFDSGVLDRQPPQVHIFPSKFHGNSHGWGANGRMAGTGVSVSTLVSAAYGFPTTARTMLATDPPEGRYDYIASLTNGNAEALQQEVKREFGVVAKIEMRETNVMLLKLKTPNAPGLKPSTLPPDDGYETWNPGHYESRSKFLGHFVCTLEQYANFPIVDQTGFTNTFDMNLSWQPDDLKKQNWDNINQALVPLGLELVPGRAPIEMLVVEKVK
jgi:uncharacterized protein (TIGR03435 family)